MSIRKILQFPDYRLRLLSKPIKIINKKTKKIIYDMFDTMYANNGIGLAAPQINILKQIIVISSLKPTMSELVLINPVILKKNKKYINTIEGCLSIPKKTAKIKRSSCIKIQAINTYGKSFTLTAKSLLSICIQHEIDHLIGKLFIDYIN
ncbi:peptide deformylase [Buchnera aphidicola]|uniref:Peptide deformylase n=2 Tax=Buchnera aphidicola (Cinara cedri) TaxID=261318 RepID=DEF_BUCCC|nr:peptide deformylase [Buchnera aphidicola]Q057D2.1 RecName: Full=Peptide deformylase; Short=PDF; AltName: Full=Polypeptide deformylase [Buchnera aphidicola BCc]AAW72679.1 polypeptide deformylase [Buchnera aphidicola (Cinara cedri)]ABJ90767.1 polypeptide deformylase [Buchnera aphidicola BCc]